MVAAITGLVVPGNQRHFGAKVAARILSFYCRNFCRQSNQKKCYKHVALEFGIQYHGYLVSWQCCWTRYERYKFWIKILSQLLAAVHVYTYSFNVRCTLVLAVIQRSHKHFWVSLTLNVHVPGSTQIIKLHCWSHIILVNMHLNAISHFLPFGALRLSNGPLKLEMSHWN